LMCRLPKVWPGTGERDDFLCVFFEKRNAERERKAGHAVVGGRKDRASLVTFADASC